MALCKVNVCWIRPFHNVLIARVVDPACDCYFNAYSDLAGGKVTWHGRHPVHNCRVAGGIDPASKQPIRLIFEIPDHCVRAAATIYYRAQMYIPELESTHGRIERWGDASATLGQGQVVFNFHVETNDYGPAQCYGAGRYNSLNFAELASSSEAVNNGMTGYCGCTWQGDGCDPGNPQYDPDGCRGTSECLYGSRENGWQPTYGSCAGYTLRDRYLWRAEQYKAPWCCCADWEQFAVADLCGGCYSGECHYNSRAVYDFGARTLRVQGYFVIAPQRPSHAPNCWDNPSEPCADKPVEYSQYRFDKIFENVDWSDIAEGRVSDWIVPVACPPVRKHGPCNWPGEGFLQDAPALTFRFSLYLTPNPSHWLIWADSGICGGHKLPLIPGGHYYEPVSRDQVLGFSPRTYGKAALDHGATPTNGNWGSTGWTIARSDHARRTALDQACVTSDQVHAWPDHFANFGWIEAPQASGLAETGPFCMRPEGWPRQDAYCLEGCSAGSKGIKYHSISASVGRQCFACGHRTWQMHLAMPGCWSNVPLDSECVPYDSGIGEGDWYLDYVWKLPSGQIGHDWNFCLYYGTVYASEGGTIVARPEFQAAGKRFRRWAWLQFDYNSDRCQGSIHWRQITGPGGTWADGSVEHKLQVTLEISKYKDPKWTEEFMTPVAGGCATKWAAIVSIGPKAGTDWASWVANHCSEWSGAYFRGSWQDRPRLPASLDLTQANPLAGAVCTANM